MDRLEFKKLICKAKMHNGNMGLVFDYSYNGVDCICKLYNLETFYRNDDIKNSINIPLVLGAFVFYFLGGYLLYASLFAAVGSAVNEDPQDAQG